MARSRKGPFEFPPLFRHIESEFDGLTSFNNKFYHKAMVVDKLLKNAASAEQIIAGLKQRLVSLQTAIGMKNVCK